MHNWPHAIPAFANPSTNTSNPLPKISIVTPSFNQGAFIEETILSVINQNYPNIEYIIIDGGSTDESVSIINRYEDHINSWVSEPDNGQSDAIIKGFKKCTGDLILWLNSDDLLTPGALHLIASIWQKHPEVGLITGNCHQLFDLKTIDYKPLTSADARTKAFDHKRLNYQNPIRQPSTYINRKAYEECGGVKDDYSYCMDYDLWVNLSRHNYEIVETQAQLSVFRLHDQCKSVVSSHRFLTENLAVAIRYQPDLAIISRIQRLAEYLIEQEATTHVKTISKLIEDDITETFPKEKLTIKHNLLLKGIFLAIKSKEQVTRWRLFSSAFFNCYKSPRLLIHLIKTISS
ncbi:glycosyltransferase family 2 protein [Rubellicoccus peritrichatus]|uniref:Glycosyltransferase family 2 protein n=1 Tax=Rubellicoccus peritrichatus TaxID=3080537 RepID=A0AAQ3QTK8_9BACT|nr:glycosyltransferase family 2 protein [Puniceicoccus sp. CR14]WOO41431.1 glycosyltransferase family 2 protein [Puniceicoccus sp. CR14]